MNLIVSNLSVYALRANKSRARDHEVALTSLPARYRADCTDIVFCFDYFFYLFIYFHFDTYRRCGFCREQHNERYQRLRVWQSSWSGLLSNRPCGMACVQLGDRDRYAHPVFPRERLSKYQGPLRIQFPKRRSLSNAWHPLKNLEEGENNPFMENWRSSSDTQGGWQIYTLNYKVLKIHL